MFMSGIEGNIFWKVKTAELQDKVVAVRLQKNHDN